MITFRRIRAFTLVEFLIALVIIAGLLALSIPAMNAARENGRRVGCLSRNKQIGLAIQNYAATFLVLPSSARVIQSPGSTTVSVGGFSHLVKILPFMEYDSLYRTLPIQGDPENMSNPATVAALSKQITEFICPSNSHGPNARASSGQPVAAITSYKGVGATTRGSLTMVLNPQATPPYGTMTTLPGVAPLHPDGVMFPGAGTRFADVTDGTAHTLITIETIDDVASRWTVGKEATLVGLPQKSSPTGVTPQSSYPYFAPPGFDGTFEQPTGVSKAGVRTFLSYDFSPQGAEAGQYEDAGFGAIAPAYGPSSMHPGIMNCGYVDGSVQQLSKNIDAAAFFFMITKNGTDPFACP